MWLRDTPVATDAAIFFLCSVVLWRGCGKWRRELRGFEAKASNALLGSLGMCDM